MRAPALAKLVIHCAVPAMTGTVLQPEMVAPFALKVTVPVGVAPATVAVNVTDAPMITDDAEVTIAVLVGGNAPDGLLRLAVRRGARLQTGFEQRLSHLRLKDH